jgi:hypothetical protein
MLSVICKLCVVAVSLMEPGRGPLYLKKNIGEREEDEENEQKEDEEEGSRAQASYYDVGGQSGKK